MHPACLSIAAPDLALIEAEARRSVPREACGLLVGTETPDGTLSVGAIVPCANVADGLDRFEIDPKALLATHRALRGGPAQIIGHYHSHPGGPALPSASDRAAAHTPGLAWLILGIAADGAVTRAAFLHRRDVPPPPPLVPLEALRLTIRPQR